MKNLFVTVPETILPGGLVVPEFQVGKFLSSRSADGKVAITAEGVMAPFSAFYLRREAGDSACDGFMPVEPVSTFNAQHATARIIHANPAEI